MPREATNHLHLTGGRTHFISCGRGNQRRGVLVTKKIWGLDLRLWDVERGTAIWADAADKDVVIDMGASEFSPLEHVSSRYGVRKINFMVVTHPHQDHIEDVVRYEDLNIRVSTLCYNCDASPLLQANIDEEDDDLYLDIATSYQEFLARFTQPASIDPTSEGWARGTTFTTYNLELDGVSGSRYKKMNNLSVMTVVERNGFKLITAGDILKSGLKTMMEDTEIRRAVSDADILIAPHHGRESSYLKDFVDLVDPQIVLISDKSDDGNNHAAYYEMPGATVYNELAQEEVNRNTLTTRQDGRLRVRANNGDDWLVSFYPRFGSRKAKGAMTRAQD